MFLVVSCGGGGDTSIDSPGELGQVSAPTAADQQVVVGGSVLTGTCPSASNIDVDDSIGGNTVCAISGTITGDLTLTDDVIYRLSGTVNVGADMGGDGTKAGGSAGVLNIPAGVTIVSKTSADYLVVQRGSKIEAKGTASKPIVFTHSSVLDGSLTVSYTHLTLPTN